MSDRNVFDWERPLTALIAENHDHPFAVMIDGASPNEALAKCEKLLAAYIAAHDDASARRQVEYLLTMRRDGFAAVPDADASSVRFGTAMAAIGLWRELPRYQQGHAGGPSQPTLLETKGFLARVAADAWASSEVDVVSHATLFRSLTSLPTFGGDESRVLWTVVVAAARWLSPASLCQDVISLIETSARAPQGSMESRPPLALFDLIAVLMRMAIGYGEPTRPLAHLAAGLRVWQALNDGATIEAPSAGPILEAQARALKELQGVANCLNIDLWRACQSAYSAPKVIPLRPEGSIHLVKPASIVRVHGIGELRVELRIPVGSQRSPDELVARAMTFFSSWKSDHAPDVRITGSIEVYDPDTDAVLAHQDIVI